MAETSEAEHPPQTNGLPEENEEDDKSKMRPADIDADMREMERRKRVEMIMSSRLFREELERIIESQMKEGGGPAGLLQQIQDMVGAGRLHSGAMFKNSNCVVPINDIRGVESMGYAKGEKILRCKLASVFRLMDLYGWTHGINNNITARLNQEEEHFIVNPYGMMFHEVTASSLVKVDMQGNIVESGTTNFGVNTAGFQLHAAVHSARPDIKCIIHIHTPSVLAVSSLKCGLLPVCQESAVIGEISQHPYLGPISEPEEKDKIARNLGPLNKVMFLTNYGAVCCGETVEEAFFNVYNTVLACETQVKLMPIGVDNLLLLSEESRKQMYDASRKAPEGTAIQQPGSTQLPTALEKKEKRWRIGGMEFEALMRMLDNAGFRTGYLYRTPLVKGEPPRPRNDVEVPPAVSSLGYLLEEEEMYKQGNWKKGFYNKNDRTKWLNSPNVYQKVEILETGTPDPKKITKWVADGSPNHTSTPVKIDGALQFVPKNTNPKEFKKLQQQIKENRRADKITSGPQSHILDEGVSWDEAKKLQDANISMTGDQVIMVGTASKGIIQRGFQHNATVYKTPYAKNPFDYVSDQELEDYKKVVTRKQKGEYYDEDQSESEPLSSSAALPPTGVIKSPPSETEDDSRTEPRVLRIETKTAPVPSQAEVVLSDVDDYPPPHVERSKSQRYPQNKVAEKGVTKRSASLERPKTKPVITDERGNSSTVGVVKARILTLEQLLKEKSTSETLNRNKIKTRTTSTQTVLRIYFEEDSTDYRLDQVGHTIIKPFTNIATSDRSKPTTKPNSISSSYQMENDRRKSLMFELHRELSVKFKNNTVFKKDENINFDKEEYASCTVYSLPNSRTGDIWKEQISTTDFTSDSTNSSPASSLEDEDINSKDDAHSIRSYVGDDYQVGENMGSIENLSSNNSTDSFVSSVNAEDNVVVKTPPLLDEDKQKSQIDIDCSEIKAVKELRNNVTVRKQKQTKNIMTDVNTEDIKNVMEDLLLKVCVMENQESLIKCDHSFHHSSVSVISPTSHSSPLVATCSDSGYEADTDRTIIHNGTALFARFNLDYTITDLDEPLPLPPRRKLDSLDEFSVVESAVNCIKTTDTDHIPRPSRSYSPDFKEQCICRRRRRHSDMIAVKSVESKENETSRQNKSDGDLTANPYCIAPEVIYLQNGHNQVIAFKRTSLDSDLLNKMSCECNQDLKSPMFTLPSENNDDTVEHDIFPSGSKIVESNQEQNINSSLIGKVSNNSPVEISRIRQNASRTSQEVPRLQEIYRDHNSNQFSFTDNHCNTYSSVNDVHDYSHMYRNNNLSNGNGEDILHKEYYYGSHEGDPGHKNNHPSYDIYNHTFSKEDIDSVDNIISYNSLRNHSDLKNVRYFNGMLHNTAFATETQEHIYAAESTYTTPPEESLCVIESQASEYGYDAPKGIDFNNCETTQSLSFPNYPPLQDSTYNGVGRPDCYTETEQQPVYNQDELITYYPQQNSLQYFIVKEGATFTGVPPVNIKNPQELQNQEHNEIISCIEEKQQSDGNCVQEATSLEQNYIFPELYSPIQGQNNNLWATHSDIIENKEINYNTQNLEHYQNSCPDGQEQIMIPEQYYYNNMNNYGNVSSCQYNPYEADNYDPKIGYQYNNQTHYNNINEISTKENEYALTEYDNGCHNTVNNTSLDYTYTMNYMRDYYFEDEAITSFSVNNRYLYTIYENEELIQ